MPPLVDLQERAARRGREWAQALSADVLRDRRTLEGGFPGTLSEARMYALCSLALDELPDLARTEVVRAVYESARAHWLAGCRSQLPSGSF